MHACLPSATGTARIEEMGRRPISPPEAEAAAAGGAIPDPFPPGLQWPFGRLDPLLSRDELRESAYEIFFAACRSGSGARFAYHHNGHGTPARVEPEPVPGGGRKKNMHTVVHSRLKRELGLRTRKARRPMVMTSAEMMRRQMGVTEQSDSRVRKALARCLVGPQASRRVESVVLPMELLRHVKPSEFGGADEYRLWQLRQLKVLEAGLVSHPSLPLPLGDLQLQAAATTLRGAVQVQQPSSISGISSAVVALAWRSGSGSCHWADGYPLNVHLYLCLLRAAVFDPREHTVVLDEVDELLELIKKTWAVLGLDRATHNACFTWLLLERHVVTGELDPDLLSAALAMLPQLSGDGDHPSSSSSSSRSRSRVLASLYSWAETKLSRYHEAFPSHKLVLFNTMENTVSLAVAAAGMLGLSSLQPAHHQVERYITSSVRRAFTKLHDESESGTTSTMEMEMEMDSMMVQVEEDPGPGPSPRPSEAEALMLAAARAKDMGRAEREVYGPILRRWHPCPAAVAAATLHACFGALLRRHVSSISKTKKMMSLSSESVRALHAASRLDAWLLQMAAADHRLRPQQQQQMIPYQVDSIISGLIKAWMDERLQIGAECVRRARDSERWNPKSKGEPYAESAVDLMTLVTTTVEELLEMELAAAASGGGGWGWKEHLVHGIDQLVHQYASFVATTCGSKEMYDPPLPPLTRARCSHDSMLLQLWKLKAPCQHHQLLKLTCGDLATATTTITKKKKKPPRLESHTTSRGTQRLYVRLNTLHYMLAALRSASIAIHGGNAGGGNGAVDAALLHVSETAAYRLVFLDSAPHFHQALYQPGPGPGPGARVRILPALRVLKHNLAFLAGVLTHLAQPAAVHHVLKASLDAFLMVLLAGDRPPFTRSDYDTVAEDFASLKRLFRSVSGQAAAEEEREAEGVVALMALSTHQLINLLVAAMAITPRPSLPMPLPPTPRQRRWSRSDANTLIRVLCHRHDEAATKFLKKTFHLPKRR